MQKKKIKSRKSQPRKQRVLIKFMQDNSGSMEPRWLETVSGFKLFVDDLKSKKDVKYALSLTLFNTLTQSVITALPIHEVDSDALSAFRSGGGTALYDALGESLGADLGESAFDKIIYVIVTDGEENSSRVWTKDKLHTLIDEKISGGKSTFTYLGAQPETWDDAAKLGLSAGMAVACDIDNSRGMYAAVADSVNNFSSSALRATDNLVGAYAGDNLIRAANLTIHYKSKPKPDTK